MRILPQGLYIRKLKRTLPNRFEFRKIHSKSDEECYQGLRQLSGKDFGVDIDAWEKWWNEERKELGQDYDQIDESDPLG